MSLIFSSFIFLYSISYLLLLFISKSLNFLFSFSSPFRRFTCCAFFPSSSTVCWSNTKLFLFFCQMCFSSSSKKHSSALSILFQSPDRTEFWGVRTKILDNFAKILFAQKDHLHLSCISLAVARVFVLEGRWSSEYIALPRWRPSSTTTRLNHVSDMLYVICDMDSRPSALPDYVLPARR